MYLHPHLLPYHQQPLRHILHLHPQGRLLQLLHHLVADEEVHTVILPILLSQLHKPQHGVQRISVLLYPCNDVANGLD